MTTETKFLAPFAELMPYAPFDHQDEGARALFENDFLLLADEPGLGKTKQIIDTAFLLYISKEIHTVIVICPSPVKSVWSHPDFGQIYTHKWKGVNVFCIEYHTKSFQWGDPKGLVFIVTSYDFLRNEKRRKSVEKQCGKGVMLVFDESSYIKNWNSIRTKACRSIRKKCDRVYLLNGTPVSNSPLDLFAQGNIMDLSILDCTYKSHFISRYAKLGGYYNRQMVAWPGLPELRKRFKPYVLYRQKKDCLDLPEKLPSKVLTVPLSRETWSMYQSTKKSAIVNLDENNREIIEHHIVKLLRMRQITSGLFKERVIGDEKFKFFCKWYKEALETHSGEKFMIWCAFRQEAQRIYDYLKDTFDHPIYRMVGSQPREERDAALASIDPSTAKDGHSTCVSTLGTGSVGVNGAAVSVMLYMSNVFSLDKREQSEDRAHRPGQTRAVSYYDCIATGPSGERTIDATVVKMLKSKQDLATLTYSEWLTILMEE